METTENQVLRIIADALALGNMPLREQSLLNDLNADSLDVTEIIMLIEDAFKIPIEDQQVEGVVTVGDLIDVVERLLADKSVTQKGA